MTSFSMARTTNANDRLLRGRVTLSRQTHDVEGEFARNDIDYFLKMAFSQGRRRTDTILTRAGNERFCGEVLIGKRTFTIDAEIRYAGDTSDHAYLSVNMKKSETKDAIAA